MRLLPHPMCLQNLATPTVPNAIHTLHAKGNTPDIQSSPLKKRLDIIRDLSAFTGQEKPLDAYRCQKPFTLALEQVFNFLKDKKPAKNEEVYTHLSVLKQNHPALEDFLAKALEQCTRPISIKVCRQYAHYLVKQEGGEEALSRIAAHEGLPSCIRVACALELSFQKHPTGAALLAKFMSRKDFSEHEPYMLKCVRAPILKQTLLRIAYTRRSNVIFY